MTDVQFFGSTNIRVLGYCPACGQDKLFVPKNGGAVLCHHMECPEPTAAHDILADRETQHVVTFTEKGWTLRHPLIERIEDRLMACSVHEMISELKNRPEPGTYRVKDVLSIEGGFR
jgi:Family of unknown function (DUF6085)